MLASVLPGRAAPYVPQGWGESLGPGAAFSAARLIRGVDCLKCGADRALLSASKPPHSRGRSRTAGSHRAQGWLMALWDLRIGLDLVR
jgi:hypothetical protein